MYVCIYVFCPDATFIETAKLVLSQVNNIYLDVCMCVCMYVVYPEHVNTTSTQIYV